MSKITIHSSLKLTKDQREKIEALYFFPGESVKVDQEIQFNNDEGSKSEASRISKLKDRTLKIKETQVVPDKENEGCFIINYIFEGVNGTYNSQAFTNPEGIKHFYGTLINRQFQVWFVPLHGDFENPTAAQPLLIDQVMPRSAKYCFGIKTESDLSNYFNSHEAAPATGEYYLIPLPNQSFQLSYSPWMRDASAVEIEIAEQAIQSTLSKNTDSVESEDIMENDPCPSIN